MAFELSKLNTVDLHEKGTEVEIVLPNGETTDWKIRVLGIHSKKLKKYARDTFNAAQKELNLLKAKKKDKEYDLAEIEKDNVEQAVLATISWSGLTDTGKDVPFTVEKARAIYTENPFVVDAVLEACKDSTLFC